MSMLLTSNGTHFSPRPYDVSTYPTVLIIIDGQIPERLVGTQELSDLKQQQNQILNVCL